ncbi:MAG: hypothetical protein ACI8PB_000928 [Desulforhopalus sp.]|jgi:hypothetical protein
MVESPEKDTKQDSIKIEENIIVTLFKKILGINYHEYGGKKDILK